MMNNEIIFMNKIISHTPLRKESSASEVLTPNAQVDLVCHRAKAVKA